MDSILVLPTKSPSEFKQAMEFRGWTAEMLAKHWDMSKRRVHQIMADTARPRYYDDAVDNLPQIGATSAGSPVVQIHYENGSPINLTAQPQDLLLYGMDGSYAEGPVLGAWDASVGRWFDNQGDVLTWTPLFYAVPPVSPCQSFQAPTVGNELA